MEVKAAGLESIESSARRWRWLDARRLEREVKNSARRCLIDHHASKIKTDEIVEDIGIECSIAAMDKEDIEKQNPSVEDGKSIEIEGA